MDEEKKKINQNQTELDEWKVTSTLDDGGVDASGFTAYYIKVVVEFSPTLYVGKGPDLLMEEYKETITN